MKDSVEEKNGDNEKEESKILDKKEVNELYDHIYNNEDNDDSNFISKALTKIGILPIEVYADTETSNSYSYLLTGTYMKQSIVKYQSAGYIYVTVSDTWIKAPQSRGGDVIIPGWKDNLDFVNSADVTIYSCQRYINSGGVQISSPISSTGNYRTLGLKLASNHQGLLYCFHLPPAKGTDETLQFAISFKLAIVRSNDKSTYLTSIYSHQYDKLNIDTSAIILAAFATVSAVATGGASLALWAAVCSGVYLSGNSVKVEDAYEVIGSDDTGAYFNFMFK